MMNYEKTQLNAKQHCSLTCNVSYDLTFIRYDYKKAMLIFVFKDFVYMNETAKRCIVNYS